MAVDRAACKQRALGLLARREHSRRELERKLVQRDYPASLVAEVLDELEHSGALADERFAESFIASRAAKGQGPVRIRLELREHGLDAAEFGAFFAAQDWHGIARQVRRKRFGAAPPADFEQRARQMRFLQYRGFDAEQIDAALDLGDDSD